MYPEFKLILFFLMYNSNISLTFEICSKKANFIIPRQAKNKEHLRQ